MRILTRIIIISNLFALSRGQTGEDPNNSPIHVLSTIEKYSPTLTDNVSFNPAWVKDLKLVLPCKDIPVPKRGARLPNAPRDYRSGTHRGIDFFANWGTPIRAVADGKVVRADRGFEEVPAQFREELLHGIAEIGHTPSDIFNNILLGRAVFVDHGLDLIKGFRVITIYAHLSSINDSIKPGTMLKRGELMGFSGNTGTKDSALGTKAGAHLHWEMILQKNNQEIFLGKGMGYEKLYNLLTELFLNEQTPINKKGG